MRRYQDTVAGVVARFEGHVAKFLGDGVLAFFGWPRAYEDQVERAVRSGLAAIDAVADLKIEDGQTLEARVGIATGQVVIGDIVGEAATEADAVAGETPNLAARLQGVAAPGQVVIGSNTRLLIGETFELKELGAQSLRGFAEPVSAWWVLGESTAESRFEAAHTGALTRFVGREHELGLLRRAWQQSKSGVGQVVLISGEPGIGKSRLVDALSADLGNTGYTRITLGCSPYNTNSALFPVIVQLERVLRWQSEDGADIKLAKLEEALQDFSLPLDEAIPLFAALLSLPLPEGRYPPITVMPQQQKQQTLDATVAWLLEEAERQPVLQVWEDLHWADPSTLELLALEIEQAPTAPILNVLTFRPEFVPPWPQRSHMTPITLNRLERPEAEALIMHHATGKALPSEVVDHIVGKADGVPLYVEELTKAILGAEFLREADGGYELVGQLSEIAIPATLQDSLMARLDRLSGIREVAQLGAVLGREFAYEMVRALVSIDEAALQEGLAQLVDAELLYQRGRPPRAKYIFKHALIQDAAYESLLRGRRQVLHGRVAAILEEASAEEAEPELVAHHFTQAGMAAEAIPYWLRAGRLARKGSAEIEAIGHLTRGLDLVESLPDDNWRREQELELRITLAQANLTKMGYGAKETAAAFDRAYELAEQTGDPRQQIMVSYGVNAILFFHCEHDKTVEMASEILRIAEDLGDADLLCVAHKNLAVMLNATGRFEPARSYLDEALAVYQPQTHGYLAIEYGHDVGVSGLAHRAFALWHLGYPDQAAQDVDGALDLASSFDWANTVTYSHFFPGAVAAAFARDMEALEHHASRLVHLSEEHGFPQWGALGTVLLGPPMTARGNAEEAIEQMRRGFDLCRRVGAGICRPIFLGFLAEAESAAGRADAALKTIDDALTLTDETEERWHEPELWRLKGVFLAANKEAAEAETCFGRAIEVARGQSARSPELRAATSLARLWRGQDKPFEARELLAPVYDWFSEGFATSDLKGAKLLLDELASE